MAYNSSETSDFDAWFAGFFDGDGCISMEICERQSNEIGFEIRPMVQITHAQVAGSIDADGSVMAAIQKHSEMRIGYRFHPKVTVTQLHDDRLMNALASYCEAQDVTYSIREQTLDDPRRNQYQWRVAGIANTRTLFEPLREKFIIKREQVELLVDEILPRLERGDHHDKRGFLEVMDVVDKLTSYNSLTRRKYTKEYFEDLWDIESGQ